LTTYRVPNLQDPSNWATEAPAIEHNLVMILSLSGMVHPRPDGHGGFEPFPALHFVAGAAWNAPTIGGHLEPGSIVKGTFECFITELGDLELLRPTEGSFGDEQYPRNWYRSLM